MRLNERLGYLDKELVALNAEFRTLVSGLRIIRYGIMFNLILCLILLVILLFDSLTVRLRPIRQKQAGEPGRRTSFEGIQNARTLKDSACIFEIRTPVGVLPVAFPGIPSRESFLFASRASRSFDADQCVSSEGFLVTFTPPPGTGGVEFDYLFVTGQLSEVFHFDFIVRRREEGSLLQGQEEIPASPFFGTVPRRENPDSASERNRVKALDEAQVARVRQDLMTPCSLGEGILVALNPTDEDRIGTGRNTRST